MKRFCIVWIAMAAVTTALLVPVTGFAEERNAKIAECHKAALKVYPDSRSPEHKAAMGRCLSGKPI